MKQTKRNLAITITAIFSLTAITFYALYLGHNTALISLVFTIIGGLAGYQVAKGN